jgi:hypothetical protein
MFVRHHSSARFQRPHARGSILSILKLIEERFGLAPLSSRDANAGDLLNAFED